MDRIYKLVELDSILRRRHYPTLGADLQEKLGVSKSGLLRLMNTLRGVGAPIDTSPLGYRYDHSKAFQLPGLWFTDSELLGLKTAHELLSSTAPTLLSETLQPLRQKLDKLLSTDKMGRGQLAQRVKIMKHAGRGTGACFDHVMRALVERKQLQFDFLARTSGKDEQRKVSPQQVTHYRDNWYLEAWCHDRKALRSFALERIRNARVSRLAAREITESRMNDHFNSAYGIFGGQPTDTARLLFNAHRAQWVSEEQWHPKQVGVFLADGSYQLDIPYANSRELVMDILKNGKDVEVISPPELRREVREGLVGALQNYASAEVGKTAKSRVG